jgi:hypothetical protein
MKVMNDLYMFIKYPFFFAQFMGLVINIEFHCALR